MFTKRHEEDLAEIKALTYELGQRFQEVLKQLEQIQEVQGRLAAADRSGPAGEPEPTAGEVATPSSTVAGAKKVAGAKRARRRQARSGTAVAEGAKSGKRRGSQKGARARARKGSQAAPGAGSDE